MYAYYKGNYWRCVYMSKLIYVARFEFLAAILVKVQVF